MPSDITKIPLASDPGEAMKNYGGSYKDQQAEGNDMESRLPTASLPQGSDPKSFTMGEKQSNPQR